jgi:hypothetical protein
MRSVAISETFRPKDRGVEDPIAYSKDDNPVASLSDAKTGGVVDINWRSIRRANEEHCIPIPHPSDHRRSPSRTNTGGTELPRVSHRYRYTEGASTDSRPDC